MPYFGDDAEKVTRAPAGKYLFKIYEVEEKVGKISGNPYWQIKFETKDGVKVCDNFMFNGKAASKTLYLLAALGLSDGENFPKQKFDKEDILGRFLYITTVKDKDSDFLKCPFNNTGYEEYKVKEKKEVKKVVEEEIDEEEFPF